MTEKQPIKPFKLIQGDSNPDGQNHRYRQVVSAPLAELIEDVRLRWNNNARPVVTSHHQQQLLENPEWVFELLWDTVRHYQPEDGRGDYYIRLYLFGQTLFCLGVDLQDQPRWKHDLASGIQKEIARYLLGRDHPQTVQDDIVRKVWRAHLPMDSELKEANHKVSSYDQRQANQDEPYTLSNLLSGKSARGLAEPFGLARMMMEQMAPLDSEKQIELVSLLAADEHPVVLEALTLVLLYPKTRIRRLIPELLRDLIGLKKLSPINLRRMIIIRNWLPAKEQVVLDRLIREAKRARVECAPLDAKLEIRSFASGLDGRGEMAVWSTIKRDDHWVGCRLIFDQNQGLVDVDTRPLKNGNGMDKELEMIRKNVFLLPVSPTFLQMAIGHFLAVGLADGKLPHFQLVQLIECMGWTSMAPQRVSSADGLAALLEALPARYKSPRNIRRVLETTKCKRLSILTQSWLLKGEAIEKCLLSQLGGPNHWISGQKEAMRLICDEFLESEREMWFDRLVWIALWLKNSGKGGRVMWKYVAVLAQHMEKGKPIRELPLLMCVAERTLIGLIAQARENAAKGHPTMTKLVLVK